MTQACEEDQTSFRSTFATHRVVTGSAEFGAEFCIDFRSGAFLFAPWELVYETEIRTNKRHAQGRVEKFYAHTQLVVCFSKC